jgi:predicted Zn-dependent protease
LKSGRRSGVVLGATVALISLAMLARADLSLWVQHQPGGPLLDVLLRSISVPGGQVRFRRPPTETRPALTKMIGVEPKNAALYRLRAQEAEMQLDIPAADADWKTYADLAQDRGEGYLALADFYHRRVWAREEIAALQTVGAEPPDNFVPPEKQRAWTAYARMLPVIKDAGLPTASASAAFQSWIAHYPKEQMPRRQFVEFLRGSRQYASAEIQIAAYARAFPNDAVFPVEARAGIAAKRDSPDAAIKVYDKAFQPLWPKPLFDAYFKLLDENRQLRDFEGRAQAQGEKNPGDIDDTARLFAYYQHTNNFVAARRVLFEYRLAKETKPGSWTPAELKTLAGLFERLPDANEQARAYYALYSVPNSSAEDREAALAGMIALLLEKPDQPIRFGSGDLSLYKDIGTADSSPGFLNGLLSLVLNSTAPRWEYRQQNVAASAYFHRTEGAKLLELLEKQFPASPHRASLRSSLIDAHASYSDDNAVITEGRAFLTAFPRATQRTHVALAFADALARQQRTQEEFAVYQQMLTELAARAVGVPLGIQSGAATAAPQPQDAVEPPFRPVFPGQPRTSTSGARSADYAQVLDKYLARVAAVGQPMEALRIYRREIDRNPNDPGLYERFAGFLEQNNLGADVQDIYRRAIAKFPDKSWYDKLARWYLRTRQQNTLGGLTREATGIFTGTELEKYFAQAVNSTSVGPALNLELNLYAHQRFPEDLVFVRNLLNQYDAQGASGKSAGLALLREYWFYDAAFKFRYFSELAARGELTNQIPAVQRTGASNPAAVQFHAEAEVWLSHFEAAAPGLRTFADQYPGSLENDARAASIYRSLAAYFPSDTGIAAEFAQKAALADVPDTKLLETIGDVYAGKEDFTRAALAWSRIPRVFPGNPDGYIEAATVYWDYYRFNDALRLIGNARARFRDKALFAYEVGVIEEGRRDYAAAIDQYLAGWQAGSELARTRIVRLSTRPAQRELIYRMTANADAQLRIDVLKAQQRRTELEAYLSKEIAVETRVAMITPLMDAAREQGFETVERQGLEREIAVTLDPVERMRLRIELAKHFEAIKDIAAAARTVDALYRDNPMILGVVRARVDFDKRNKRDDDAIAALMEAAGKARTDLSAQFRFEAARIATNAGRIDEARTLLTDLLNAEPNRADYLAQMAETYAAANDDASFIQFANNRIDALKKASLPAEDRKSLIASLRRRLIATLARRNDYASAVDQYIEVVNAYPEDESAVREATLFASAHNRKDQLISFYRKTIADAPRDWRWPMVLARVETAMEDYPAALNAYDTAMKARPDRADLVEARAGLEQRLLRFDDAIASYTKLYQLTYNDAEWLDKAAEMQARLGRGAEAVATLERAHIGAGGETVTGLFQIAAVLDQCHLETDAARYAERGHRLAGNDIAKYPAQLETYGRIMAEMRRNDVVPGLADGRSVGRLIAELYTPEDKVDLSGRPGVSRVLAEAAGLEDDLALKLAALPSRQAWISLQSRRGLYEQLSRDLEALANRPGQTNIGPLLSQAAAAASKAGDSAAQIRIYARMQSAGLLPAPQLNRYLKVLLRQNPGALVAQRSDQAVQVAIAAGNQNVAMDALRARSASLPPVWFNSYTALTGVYFDDRSPAVNQAFLTVLHPQTIGERLASRPDLSRSLVGSVWFYYGARFGEYLAHGGSPEADDYLASDPESRPGDPEVYISQGRFYAEIRRFPEAIAEFRKALELDPDRGEAHDGIARALMQQGRQSEAITEWRDALAAFQREQSKGVRVRESFWTKVSAAIHAVADAKVFAELQADIHSLLADYVHRNSAYRINELVEPALHASFQSNAGFDWLLDIMAQTGGAEIVPSLDATPDERERLARFRLSYMVREDALAVGDERTRYEQQVIWARSGLVQILLNNGKIAEAQDQWRQFPPAELEAHRLDLTQVEIQLAAANGTFDQLLSRFRSEPAMTPPMYELLTDATILRQQGHVPAALSLLEFVYTRELDQQHLEIANFLGLARVSLERANELPQALAVLRRMTLVANPPFGEYSFEAFEPAGDLLIEFHYEAEAKEFFSKAVQATPWNAQAKIKLARISSPPDRTRLATEVVNDSTARYATRAAAARMLAPTQITLTGELVLLAAGDKSPSLAREPFFVESRLDAAAGVSDPALKLSLLREALAIAPDDPRVRLAAVRAALGTGNDRLALAMYQASAGEPVFAYQPPVDDQQPPDEQQQPYEGPRQQIVPDTSLLEALSAAAERTGDLATALGYVREAQPRNRQRIAALQAEQKRRQDNLMHQPIVSDKTEQTQIVRAKELP